MLRVLVLNPIWLESWLPRRKRFSNPNDSTKGADLRALCHFRPELAPSAKTQNITAIDHGRVLGHTGSYAVVGVISELHSKRLFVGQGVFARQQQL